ncbi:MAG: hypothetical protein II393_01665 [Cytophagales bacterium]|nr:hypothetical protein [Cytophagales bacterium]
MEQEILAQLKQLNILTRVNNVLLSKFILQLQVVKKKLHIPELRGYWRFELLESEYVELIQEYGREDVDEALYRLDRQLANNKLDCPNNIKKFIRAKLKKKGVMKAYNEKRKAQKTSEEES